MNSAMILVTGATGFIGRHMVRRLLNDNGKKVRIFLQKSEKGKEKEFPDAEPVFGDLTDEGAVENAVGGAETVIHLASKNIDSDGSGFRTVNVDGTHRLCQKSVQAGVKRMIYLSTVGVYGHGKHRNADETTPVRPDTDFSRSKAEAENIVLHHHRAGHFQSVILRHRFVYGEGDVHVLARMIRSAGKYPFLVSGGRARLSLILADDLAEIVCRFCDKNMDREVMPVYHVTDGYPVRYGDLIRTFCEAYGMKFPKLSIPFSLLYYPVRLRERLTGTDPETARSAVSSIRLMLVGVDNYFSNAKLMHVFPDLDLTSFYTAFPRVKEYYSRFLQDKNEGAAQ